MMTSRHGMSRRQFIRIAAVAGAAIAGGAGLDVALRAADARQRVEESRLLLGTIANLTLIGPDLKRARRAIQAAFDRMAALENVLSRFRPESQLSQLNASGHLRGADPAFVDVLARSLDHACLSDGAFDVTIEPVLALYRQAASGGQLPDPQAVEAARLRVDYRQVQLDEAEIRFGKPGMAITLDGIAKGYIIDRGADVLAEHGFANVMVELGGDLSSRGQAGDRPWQVAIRRPDRASAAGSPIAALQNRAMATSGDYMQPYTPDRRLHHIVDPASGISPVLLSSASVIAPTACEADALATTLIVLGPDVGLALIERLPEIEALAIDKAGGVRSTRGFPLVT